MPKFEHKYAALTLQDGEGVWAQFTPAQRTVDGLDVRYGVLETDDAKLAARLRTAAKADPGLTEIK